MARAASSRIYCSPGGHCKSHSSERVEQQYLSPQYLPVQQFFFFVFSHLSLSFLSTSTFLLLFPLTTKYYKITLFLCCSNVSDVKYNFTGKMYLWTSVLDWITFNIMLFKYLLYKTGIIFLYLHLFYHQEREKNYTLNTRKLQNIKI